MRLYIHIPFCLKKCSYCDFLSFPAGEDLKPLYLTALKNEIRLRLEACHDREIQSVFFGGGTPTVLSGNELAGILEEIRKYALVSPEAEISVEANPCTLDEEKAQVLHEAGFNRISIGAQSMNDGNLKILGRLHDKAGFVRAFEAAGQAGFERINIDMISGIPGQTPEEWAAELKEAAEFGSSHISAYSLELYEETPLYRSRKNYSWPSEDDLSLMYERTAEVLAAYGLRRYEISNYAKPGCECRHNTGYWTGDEYLGFGVGAASYEKNTRYSNTSDLKNYLDNSSAPERIRVDFQRLTGSDLETEFMILGLRLTRGVSRAEFRSRFGKDMDEVFGGVIGKYVNQGFMLSEDDRVRLSDEAFFVSNGILADFS